MSPTLTRTAKFVVYPSALKATAKQCQVDLLRESLKEEEKEVPLVQRQAETARHGSSNFPVRRLQNP